MRLSKTIDHRRDGADGCGFEELQNDLYCVFFYIYIAFFNNLILSSLFLYWYIIVVVHNA